MNAIDIGLRATVVVLMALLASVALRRRSAALRHSVLAVGILSAAAVAPLGLALPAWDLPARPPTAEAPVASLVGGTRPVGTAEASSGKPDWRAEAPASRSLAPVVNMVWAAGVVVGILTMLVSLRRLSRLTDAARSMTDSRWLTLAQDLSSSLDVGAVVTLRQTDLLTALGTWGWRRPHLLLPPGCETWSDERIRIVLGHELAHIRRADWPLQMAADVVRAVFWYNPLFWIAGARLRRESEEACDNAVLEAGVPAADYASHLLRSE